MKLKLTAILIVALFSFTGKINAQYNIPANKLFFIQSAKNYGHNSQGCWDIKGQNVKFQKGQNLMVWDLSDKGADRKFRFEYVENDGKYDWYNIYPEYTNGRGCVDVSGSKTSNGTNIHIWEKTGHIAQKFRLKYLGNGQWKIYAKKSGKVLCLKGKQSGNGTSIHIWDDHNASTAKWYFFDTQTMQIYKPTNTTNTAVSNDSSNIYTLQSGEEFVFGKIGYKGTQRYTVAIVRKYNPNKEFYQFYGNYYNQALNANLRKNSNPENYDKYDYYLIFNGKKFGAYDHIFAMSEKESSDIDKWVSDDGKHISFTGTVGNKWYPIIFNNKANSFRAPYQAPAYTGMGDKWAYTMWWSEKDGYKLCEQGKITVNSSKMIEQPVYSKSGKLLYVSAPDEKYGQNYIYLDHQKIDGPFKNIASNGIGFIPNTEKIYYNTSKKVKIGNKGYTCKEDETINGFKISESIISFIVLNKKSRLNTIFEYTNKTGEMISHGAYKGYVHINKYGKSFYYVSHDTKKLQYFVIDKGGKVLWEKQYLKTDGSPNCRMSPMGDLYCWYKENNVLKIEKNGKIIDFDGNIAGISLITFNPVSGMPIIHAEIDKIATGKKHHLYYGNLSFDLSGNLNAGKLYPTDNGKSIFYTVRTVQNNIWTYKLYKNGQNIDNKAYTVISDFTLSSSGDKYAMLVSNKHQADYITVNEQMDANWKLVFNSKELPGKYGAPLWSDKDNAIIVMKQVGRNIVIEKLSPLRKVHK